MKKIFTTLFAGLMISAQVMAVSIMDVCGKYDGTLLLDSEEYPGSEVYLLPGVTDNTLTFVLPDFKYNGVSDVMDTLLYCANIARNDDSRSIVSFDNDLLISKEKVMQVQRYFPKALKEHEFLVQLDN